jgi:hypothetical protein
MADAGRLEEAGRELFEYVAAHAERLQVLLAVEHGSAVERALRAAVRDRVMASGTFGAPGVPKELAAHHLSVSSLALETWWLEHGMPYDAKRMGVLYARLVVRPTRAD